MNKKKACLGGSDLPFVRVGFFSIELPEEKFNLSTFSDTI